MKLLSSFFFVLAISTSIAYSSFQQQYVTGIVTDAKTGQPITGVNVIFEGTQMGTLTDLNGNFSLPKPENGTVVIFSFIGYLTEKFTWSGQAVIDIKLSPNVLTLEEVVVTGYGTIKKKDLTGAISTVKAKDIEKSTPVNIESALQGQVPGLIITSLSGAPGSEPIVRIRGIGTVNNNNPVYVVDGVLIDPSQGEFNLNFLNPNDISSVEILKDASAQAIYGSRGANGVILITTKKGTEGVPRVTFSSSFGFKNIIRIPPVLNREEFKDYMVTCYTNGYLRTHPDSGTTVPLKTLISNYNTMRYMMEEYKDSTYTDWYKEIRNKNALNQNYNLSINGGTKYAHYAANIGYLNEDGSVRRYGYQRYSFRLNTDFTVGKNFVIGENLGITYDKRKNNDYNGPIGTAMSADPLIPVYQTKDSVSINDPNYIYDRYSASSIGGGNPLLDIERSNWTQSRLNLVGNIFTEITILKDFKFRSSMGFSSVYNETSDFSPQFYVSSSPGWNNPVQTVSEYDGISYGWIWENTLTYSKKITDHSLTALLGFTSEYTDNRNMNGSKQSTPSNDPEVRTFNAATLNPLLSGTYSIITLMSYLGRLNYSYREKYLLTTSLRLDGSSRFGPGHKWGNFPSFSLGWNLSKEDFFKNMDQEIISNLKFRGGWGQIGNSSLPVNSAYVSQVSSNSPDWWLPTRYIFGDQVYQGYTVSTIGTPNITWETTQQTNIGVDIAFLKNALTLTADYYIKDTRNMLLQVPVPWYSGYPSTASPYTNAGSVRNKGFEIILELKEKSGDFTYGASINGSVFNNTVTSLEMGNKPIDYAFSRTEVGKPIGYFRGYVVEGVFQSDFWVKSHVTPEGEPIQPYAQVGDFKFKDLNGDGKIDDNDQTDIGSPWPKLTYGFNVNLGYKAFDLSIFFQGSYGNDIFDMGMWRHLNFVGSGQEYEYIYQDAWNGPGSTNSNPILTTVDQNDNFRPSSYFVEDGSYLRLKNLQFGYNIPKKLCNKMMISNGRIWAGCTNLLTFTRYRGIDPEAGANGSPLIEAGYDWNNFFPQTREFTLGFTVTF